MDDLTDGGRIAFQLMNNYCFVDNPNSNASISWDRLVAKYRPSTAPRYMIFERDSVNSKLTLDKNPDGWMAYVEKLVGEMNKCTAADKSLKIGTRILSCTFSVNYPSHMKV